MTDGEMDMNAYASIAVLQLPTQSRLLKSACCPDKDLVVLLSRLGGKDKLSLWKMQGSKKWEIDVSVSETDTEDIVGLAWSPDGECFPYHFHLDLRHIAAQDRASPLPTIPHALPYIPYKTDTKNEFSPW